VSDFEVMPAGSGKALQRALQQLEREPGVCGRCGGLVYDPVVVQRQHEPVAWRFRTIGIEHSAWRLTDDASLVQQMRELGHWEIRPLADLADPAPQAAAAQEAR
jgi:hypothetical protein